MLRNELPRQMKWIITPAMLASPPGPGGSSRRALALIGWRFLVAKEWCADGRAHPVPGVYLDARLGLGLRDADHVGRLPLPGEPGALGRGDLQRMGAPVIDPERGIVGAADVGHRRPGRLAAGAVPQPQRDAGLAQAVVGRDRVDGGGVAAAVLSLRALADAAVPVAPVPRRGRGRRGRGG